MISAKYEKPYEGEGERKPLTTQWSLNAEITSKQDERLGESENVVITWMVHSYSPSDYSITQGHIQDRKAVIILVDPTMDSF